VNAPTFILIHGGGLTAASWTLLVEAMARRGAPAIAIELPCEDPSAGTRDYADLILSSIAIADDVVIVGHSMGGLTAPIVAAERPVRELVLLCAIAPVVGMSSDEVTTKPDFLSDYKRAHEELIKPAVDADGRYLPLPPEVARELYFQDCSPVLQEWAVEQFRPQASLPLSEVTPLRKWPQVPTRVIIGQEDRAVSPAWSRRFFRERHGIVPEEIPGDHSPFLSRPDKLASTLLRPFMA
jgi:pimeloyl-ACP methyl ester carboxylesterase